MGPTALPARITIDFRDSIDPHRGWILGVSEKPARIELLAFDEPPTTTADVAVSAAAATDGQIGQGSHPVQAVTALDGDCTCPEFCERDHANE
jgi:hypothetical protein